MPVTILEGARAVGKTALVRNLVEQGHYDGYENLADPQTRAIALADLPGWVASLPRSAVIDEAQLVPDLPLYLKFVVDEPGSGRRFLLTGSAAIGRRGLGGSDPLTGRSIRHQLRPLTAAELAGNPARTYDLVSDLFSGRIRDAAIGDSPPIETVVERGGFAPVALRNLPPDLADAWAYATVVGLLTDDVLPDERFDGGVALRVLDGCLRNPSGILNSASLGQRLGLDPRTVDRYLDVLERRFLLDFLPNLATSAVRQTRARSKVHALDSVFSIESIRRGNPATFASGEMRGPLLESWVVSQVLPAVDLAPRPVNAFYWRDAKQRKQGSNEVDLVLVDSEDRAVGLEVKASTTVGPSDAAGLVELDQRRTLAAGYVLYLGSKTIRLADRIYALPVSALWTLS